MARIRERGRRPRSRGAARVGDVAGERRGGEASFEAWNAGDMEAWANLLAPDVIWRPPKDWPEPGPFAGREAVLRQVQQNREAWDADTAEPIGDFIDAADRES